MNTSRVWNGSVQGARGLHTVRERGWKATSPMPKAAEAGAPPGTCAAFRTIHPFTAATAHTPQPTPHIHMRWMGRLRVTFESKKGRGEGTWVRAVGLNIMLAPLGATNVRLSMPRIAPPGRAPLVTLTTRGALPRGAGSGRGKYAMGPGDPRTTQTTGTGNEGCGAIRGRPPSPLAPAPFFSHNATSSSA